MQRKIFNSLYLILIVLLIISIIKIKELPRRNEIYPLLLNQPIQTKTDRENFSFSYRNKNLEVTPLADYEIWGLIVTQNNINGLFNFYKDKNEPNLKDICVIWGKNIESEGYLDNKIHFESGEFTCYTRYSGFPKIEFDHDKISNNHLLTADTNIQEKIRKLNVGDQVYLRGNLVDIKQDGRPYMKTSLSRSDSNESSRSGGACEVFYVDELEVLIQNNYFWNVINKNSKNFLIGLILLNIILFIIRTKRSFRKYAK